MKNTMQNFKHFVTPLLIAGTITLGIPSITNADPEPDGDPAHCKMMNGKHGKPGMNPMMGPMMGMGGIGMFSGQFPPFLRGIKLTETQNDKIYELVHSQEPALREKRKEIKKGHLMLHNLVLSDQYDETKAKELVESNMRTIAEMTLMVTTMHNKIYQILTPEQRKQLEDKEDRAKKKNELVE
ncbi:periplasmic protein CpxP/Spy [Gammaproteobacteria bacterium]